MSRRTFRRRFRRGTILYRGILCFLGLATIMLIPSMVVETPASSNFWFYLLAGILFVAVFLALKIKGGARRKKIYKEFKQLSKAEQAEVDTELDVSAKHVIFGATRLYLLSGFWVEMIDYRNIAWAYLFSNSVALADMETQPMMMTFKIVGMVIWDRKGTRHLIPAQLDIRPVADALERIKEKAPNAIYGYSKERLRLAKQDFDRFMVQGRSTE